MARLRPAIQTLEFPTTQWSLIVRAGNNGGDCSRQAMAELLGRYLTPMRAHLVNRRHMHPVDADDLLQAFLADRVLEDELVSCAVQGRGRFRNFLLTALDHFVLNYFRSLQAQKRQPKGHRVSRELVDVVGGNGEAGQAFDVAWGREVIEQAVGEMREECIAARRPDVWGVFEARVLRPCLESVSPTPYRELVERFNFATPSQATNILVTGNRMFLRALKSVVGRYAKDGQAVEEELLDLQRILSSSGARSA